MKQIVATLLLWIVLFFGACKKDISCETCQEEKKPPVSQAGIDRKVTLPKDSIHVDGSASTDPDGNIVSYKWEQIAGPSSTAISTPTEPKTAINAFQLGSYQFQLTVTDNDGLQAKDTLLVLVTDQATNQPPVAHAGTDIQITISNNGITLDGSNSYDPDGIIQTYKWVNLTSQLNAEIVQPDSARTNVNQLAIGVYQFQLTVTDDSGLSSKDTIVVTALNTNSPEVDCIGYAREYKTAKLTQVATLPTYRGDIKAAAAGNKIVFAGGTLVSDLYHKINVYDLGTKTFTTTDLPFAAEVGGTAVLNNKIYVAIRNINATTNMAALLQFDPVANLWSTIYIPNYTNRRNIDAVAAAGNKIIVVGGTRFANSFQSNYTLVDIFNTQTNQWRTDTLHNRTQNGNAYVTHDVGIAATVVGNSIYLAGGASDWGGPWVSTYTSVINVYNAASDTWSIAPELSIPRANMTQIEVDNKIYWAGGGISDGSPTNLVEIRDLNSGTSTFSCLSVPRTNATAVFKNNKIIFIDGVYSWDFWDYGDTFDIYDIATNTWSIGSLPKVIHRASIFTVGNTIYVAGGYTAYAHDEIYTLEF